MSIARRIEELEAAAYRMGFDALSARMGERLKGKSEAELAAIRATLETYTAPPARRCLDLPKSCRN
jgi:hypothetical protein